MPYVVCMTCGCHNREASTFCVACGGFLEWVGVRVEPERSLAARWWDEPEPEPVKRGLLARLRSLLSPGRPPQRGGQRPG